VSLSRRRSQARGGWCRDRPCGSKICHDRHRNTLWYACLMPLFWPRATAAHHSRWRQVVRQICGSTSSISRRSRRLHEVNKERKRSRKADDALSPRHTGCVDFPYPAITETRVSSLRRPLRGGTAQQQLAQTRDMRNVPHSFWRTKGPLAAATEM
jgi:hypothetical protein